MAAFDGVNGTVDGETVNIASFLPRLAAERPFAPAIFQPQGRDAHGKVSYVHATYRQLDRASDEIARGLTELGVGRGVRTVLMVKPSLEFFALTFGLFRAGAVPVLVDPGMGVKNLKACLAEAAPEAFIGIPPAHVARLLLGWARGSLRTLVTVGRRLGWGGTTLAEVRARGAALRAAEHGASHAERGASHPGQATSHGEPAPFLAPTQAEDHAAILFTSGSTGVPKGAVYTHAMFVQQVELIRRAYDIRPGEVDLPTFPLFALFDPALGMTTVVPDMDFTRPARVDPRKLREAVEDFGVTFMFGSPALLDTVGRFAEAERAAGRDFALPTIRKVISAGAPVAPAVIRRFLACLPEGARLHTPYGATECLPVSTIDSDTILGDTGARTATGAGVCVGRPLDENTVRVIGIDDGPLEAWDEARCLPAGQVGEIVVKGPTASPAYFRREATALAKMQDGEGFRHRMGDVGYFDEQGRLWFCGRKAHRVPTAAGLLHSVPVEGVFDAHPAVRRTALVGVGPDGGGEAKRPVICVERVPGDATPWPALVDALKALGAAQPHTAALDTFLEHPGFPVDIRHNAKIRREDLTVWAARKLRTTP